MSCSIEFEIDTVSVSCVSRSCRSSSIDMGIVWLICMGSSMEPIAPPMQNESLCGLRYADLCSH